MNVIEHDAVCNQIVDILISKEDRFRNHFCYLLVLEKQASVQSLIKVVVIFGEPCAMSRLFLAFRKPVNFLLFLGEFLERLNW